MFAYGPIMHLYIKYFYLESFACYESEERRPIGYQYLQEFLVNRSMRVSQLT